MTSSTSLLTRPRAGALALLVFALTAAPALAGANQPLVIEVFPDRAGAARAQDASVLSARYDRTLSEQFSTFKLWDASGTPVPGTTYLSHRTGDDPALRRIINFRPHATLDETASPYRARAVVQAAVPAGETVTEWTFEVDDTAPVAPVVADPTNGDVRTERPIVVTGTAEDAATILVIEDGEVIATDRVASSGLFDVFMPYPPEDGVSHTFEVFQRDRAGNISPGTGPITIWHDSVVEVPFIVYPAEGALVATSAVAIRGTAKPNSTVTVRVGGAPVGTTTVDAGGEWTFGWTFADGSHVIAAESWDGRVVDGPSADRTFVVDTSAPPGPAITTPAPGAILNSPTVLIEGTAEPDVWVVVRIDGTIRTQPRATPAGAWSATLTLPDGPHTIDARAVDAAGNESAPATRGFTIDSLAPSAPMIVSPISGWSTASTSVTVTGRAEANTAIEILEGGTTIGSGAASGTGSFTIGVTLAEGEHTLRAIATDAAGNISVPSPGVTITVDTTAPLAPVILRPTPGGEEGLTAYVIGTAEAGSLVEVFEGATFLDSFLTNVDGEWGVAVELAAGAHTVKARATDGVGNVGPFSAPVAFDVVAGGGGPPPGPSGDTTAPDPPILIAPAESEIVPGFVTFEGTAENGSTVTIYESGAPIASGTANGGTFDFGVYRSHGSHSVTATATDPAKNESAPTSPRAFTVDAHRPTLSVATRDGAIFGRVFDAQRIEGTATDGDVVWAIEVEYRDLDGVVVDRIAFCGACPASSVGWSDEPSLSTGTYVVTVRAIDRVGNRSQPEVRRIYVI